jgi:hypothetical protein
MVRKFIFAVESGRCGELGAQGGLTGFLPYCDGASASGNLRGILCGLAGLSGLIS